MSATKIVVLATGGTIAGRAASAHDNVGYQAAQLGVEHLLDGLPGPASFALTGEQVAQVDSRDMDFRVWVALAQRCADWLARDEVQGIVVTHGTDTLEETAFFLQSVLAPAKPVVLTGAMRPATSAAADGPQNLADALVVAACPEASGVSVVFAGEIHDARDVAKRHNYRLDAFSSGDAGLVGHVEEGRLRLLRAWPASPRLCAVEQLRPPSQWPRVDIVLNHAGADGGIVRALLAQGVDGLVVAGTGNGTLHHALQAALVQAQEQGVRVRRTTRCAEGIVLPAPGDQLPHVALSAVKARVALMLELMA